MAGQQRPAEHSLRYFLGNRKRRRMQAIALLFIAPVLVYTVLFRFLPMIGSFFLSFTDYNMLSAPKWLGVQNYFRLFRYDLFWIALRNTAQYALEVLPLNIAISLGLAILVNKPLRGMAVFRTLFYLPVLTSIVAASMIWLWIYNDRLGVLNSLLEMVGWQPIDWVGDPRIALHSLVAMRVWKGVGWNMVIYLAGLQSIPRDVCEAARIDGAAGFTFFRRITWPLVLPVTFYILIMGLISTFQTFGEIYAMTHGGPLDATTTVGYLIYRQAFDYFEMGAASSTAFVLFGIILALSMANRRFARNPY